MIALDRQKIKIDSGKKQSFLVLFTEKNRNAAIRLSDLYRTKKVNVNMMIYHEAKGRDFYLDYAKRHDIGHIVIVSEDESVLMIQVLTGNVKKETLSSILE